MDPRQTQSYQTTRGLMEAASASTRRSRATEIREGLELLAKKAAGLAEMSCEVANTIVGPVPTASDSGVGGPQGPGIFSEVIAYINNLHVVLDQVRSDMERVRQEL